MSSAPRVIRWLLPAGVPGIAYAHAAIVGGDMTVCRGHHVAGAIYPPSTEIPRCPACLEVVARHVEPEPTDQGDEHE